MQQPEQTYHRLVRVQVGGVAGPAVKQLALPLGVEDPAVKWFVGVGVQASGGVSEDVAVLAGEPEEDLQGVQLAGPVARVVDAGEEGFDVAGADEGPVGDGGTVGVQYRTVPQQVLEGDSELRL